MSKKRRTGPRTTNDALALATFRWFANAVENRAVVLYGNDKKTFAQVCAVLRKTVKDLAAIQPSQKMEGKVCPDGWLLCWGVCMPSCDDYSAASAESSAEASAALRRGRGGRSVRNVTE